LPANAEAESSGAAMSARLAAIQFDGLKYLDGTCAMVLPPKRLVFVSL
jgi:hypothetical protein